MKFTIGISSLLAIFCLFGSITTAQLSSTNNSSALGAAILHDLESLTTCVACEALLILLQALAHTGNQNFINTIVDICILAKLEDDDVCKGAIASQGPILAHDLRGMTIGSYTSLLFCASVFGLCDYPAVRDYDLNLPPAPTNSTRPSSPSSQQQPSLKIVHISDIHVDLSYTTGSNYNCTKPICCRPYTPADAAGNTSYPAGEFGNTHCDAPLSLEESMYTAISTTIAPDAAFVIFTGDVVEGAVWLVTETENTHDITDAYINRMQPHFPLVYSTVGNHEAAPVNSFPPDSINTTISSQWVYNALSNSWSSWLGQSTSSHAASNSGSYSTLFSPNLKIISINTNFYYNQNFWLFSSPEISHDPNNQLAWLISELQSAEDANQRVYILGHMPMGSSSALHEPSAYFDAIINRYSTTIAALFFGHTHKDEFELSYSSYSSQNLTTAAAMSYIAPAMTPTSGNPAFRVYDVDPVTFGVRDFTEYFANLSSPTYQTGPIWEKLYSAKEAYGAHLPYPITDEESELTPAFWHNVTVLFEENDEVFQEYYGRKSRGYAVEECTGTCKTEEICQLRAANAQYNCVKVKPGLQFKRRKRGESDGGGGGGYHVDECDTPVASRLFAVMQTDQELMSRAVEIIQGAL